MNKLTVADLDVRGKRVLMRVDFNVPLKNGAVADDKRIRAVLPTVRRILEQGGRLILISHLGRPKGRRVGEMSLEPCAAVLSALLGKPVGFVSDCVGDSVATAVATLGDGQVVLLENLRYHRQETENDPDFARELAGLADLYVNDAFGTAHRAHASTQGVTAFVERCAAGYLMTREINYLGRMMSDPGRPFVAILGGAKVSGKIDVITHLLPRVDTVIVGGAMAYTFYRAKGWEVGASLVEPDRVAMAADIMARGGEKLVLPVDCMVSDRFDFSARTIGELACVPADAIPAGWYGLDIGPRTMGQIRGWIMSAATVVWNGPMGVCEIPETAQGTVAVAQMLAEATTAGAVTVVGGGDSAAAVRAAGLEARLSHVSTGGGASLAFLEGRTLPGIAALTDKT